MSLATLQKKISTFPEEYFDEIDSFLKSYWGSLQAEGKLREEEFPWTDEPETAGTSESVDDSDLPF